MKSGLYKIGEISEIFSLPTKTLRYYEEIGLLTPEYVSEDSKYRYYSRSQFERIRLIIYLKGMDLSLKEIRHQLDTKSGEEYTRMLSEHCEIMERRIEKEIALRDLMKSRLREIEIARAAPKNVVFFEEYPEWEVVLFRRVICGREEKEQAALDFQRSLKINPGVGRFGQLFDLEKLMQHRDDVCKGIFLLSDYMDAEDKKKVNHCIPSGTFAVMYYSKLTDNSYPFWLELLSEIERNNYEPIGDGIRTIILESGIGVVGDDYIARIRIPVRKKRSAKTDRLTDEIK